LRVIESTADGGYDQDVGAVVHPDNIHIAVRAAALFDLEVAGVDIC
jgi:cyanophycin synthetase